MHIAIASLPDGYCSKSHLDFSTFLSKVNVERALRSDGRNSGHFVQVRVGICLLLQAMYA